MNEIFTAIGSFFSEWGNTEIWLVVCFSLGISLASLATVLTRQRVWKLTSLLESGGADSPANALTLRQLGLAQNGSVRRSLRPGKTMRRLVSARETESADLCDLPLYLTEKQRDRIHAQYKPRRAEWVFVPVTFLLMFILSAAIISLLPVFLNFAKSVFS